MLKRQTQVGKKLKKNDSKPWEEDSGEKKNQPKPIFHARTCFGKHRLTRNCTKVNDPSCLGLGFVAFNPSPVEVRLSWRRGQLYSTTLHICTSS